MGNIFAVIAGIFAGFIVTVGNGNPIGAAIFSVVIGGMCWVAFGSFGDAEKLRRQSKTGKVEIDRDVVSVIDASNDQQASLENSPKSDPANLQPQEKVLLLLMAIFVGIIFLAFLVGVVRQGLGETFRTMPSGVGLIVIASLFFMYLFAALWIRTKNVVVSNWMFGIPCIFLVLMLIGRCSADHQSNGEVDIPYYRR